MTEPYLIAHLVRGQPAFDIAERMTCPVCHRDEERIFTCDACESHGFWWIIPTSGHRAYPYWSTSLEGVLQGELCVSLTDSWLAHTIANPPEGHPDHYSTSAAPRGQGLITNLAERLGFLPAPPRITRR